MEELLPSLFAILPERYVALVGAVLVTLGALRTLLRGVIAVCYALDFALDGEYNWAWIGKVGDALDRFDAALAKSRWFPVKAIGLKGRS